ncbi:MAG: ABC transporter substrate-binding protein [Anaerolineales bacterium]
MFADIVGSTSIAEKLDPEEWKEVVQGAHRCVSETVHRYEGTIAQLLGDGVLAFFGAPLTHEDDPERAVRAGLDLQESIAEYRRELAGFVDDFHMRVGIHAGEVVVGPVGTEEHMEYLAIGDAVNVAARLESAANPGEILISETCVNRVQHMFEFAPFKSIKAKGKSEKVRAAVLQGFKAVPGFARGIAGIRTPFVGRRTEVEQLRKVLQALCQGQGGIVILTGEAGIGKSRLLEHMREICNDSDQDERLHPLDPGDLRWLEGRALSYGAALSYWMIQQLLLADLGLSDGASQVKIKAALRTRLQELFGEEKASRVFPYLSHLMDLDTDDAESLSIRSMDGEAIKYQSLIYLCEYFRRAAGEKATVLIFEDLHWADPSSLEALEKLLPLVEQIPLLLVLLMRVDREHGSWKLKTTIENQFPHRTTGIALLSLEDHDAQILVEQLLQPDSLPEAARQLILKRAEGNPFYLEEIARHLLESGLIVERGGRWEPVDGLDENQIPDTLQGVILARIDRLEQDLRETLQMASVIGKSFLFKILRSISDAERDLERHLSQLQRADLVREKTRLPEREYLFKHILTQEVAYNSLLHERRKAFHQRVGEALETLFSERRSEYFGMMAYHFLAAGKDDKAAKYYILAGDKARCADAQDEAIDLYQAALPCLTRLNDEARARQIWLRLGLSHHLNSRYRESRQAYNMADQLLKLKHPAPTDTSVGTKVISNRTVRLLYRSSWIRTLDPGINDTEWEISHACFSGLTRLDETLGVKPLIAWSWNVSGDGKTYLFHLRDDVLWTDGRTVTADQFEWAWLRNLSPDINNPLAFLLDDVVGAYEYRTGATRDPHDVGVRAIDPQTLEVRLRTPANYFLYITANGISYPLPYWVVEKYGDEWWHPEHIVSNGYFKIKSYTQEGVTLLRNHPFKLESAGNIDEVFLRMLKSDEEDISIEREFQDYKDDKIDVCRVINEEILNESPDEMIGEFEPDGTNYLLFNPSVEPLNDIRVRRAFARVIEPARIQSVRPLGSPANGGLVHPRTQGHTPGINLPSYTEAALQDLFEAGYPEGRGCPEILLRPVGIFILSAGHSIAEQLKRHLGINVRVLPPSSEMDNVHIVIGGWVPDYPDPDSILRMIGRRVDPWLPPEDRTVLDALFHQAQGSIDRKFRLSKYREIDKWLVHDQVICKPLYYYDYAYYLRRPWIKYFSPMLNSVENIIIED